MANQFQSISSGLAELKNFYQGPIVDQFSEDVAIWRGAAKENVKWSGAQVNRPLRVRRNTGIGATADNGLLPAVGRQTTIQAVIAAKYNYLRFGVTGPMIKASASDVGSFVRSAAYELKMGYEDLRSDCNRQMSWDGTGDLALMSSAAVATTSITIKGRESGSPALQFVDVGLVFDIVNSSGTVQASGISVVSITSGGPSSSTAVIVLSAPVTASADDILIRANSAGNEIQGILTQLDGGTSTVFSIDRSLYPSTQGNSFAAASAQLSLDRMQEAYNAGMQRGAAKYAAIYCDFNSLRMYQKLLTADKRYVNTVKGDGGFAAKDQPYLDFNGVPLVPDKDCPTRLFYLNEGVIKKYTLAEMEFADETGSMYIAQTSTDALEVRVRFFANLFNEQASSCSVQSGYISP